MNTEETKRLKARQMRYKKPIARDLNLSTIQEELWDIQEECENVRWFCDTDQETLINALDGDEDEAYEFRMMFADLCAECDQMISDLEEEWVPECFDVFFVAAGAGEEYGEFNSKYIGFYIEWQGKFHDLRNDPLFWIPKVKIIGNVFDDPELLKVGAND